MRRPSARQLLTIGLLLFMLHTATSKAASPDVAAGNYCLAFQLVSDYAMPSSVFSEADLLPKESLTISLKFRIIARGSRTGTGMYKSRAQMADSSWDALYRYV